MMGRRLSFWVAVGGISILSNFLLEVAATRWPQLGLARFTSFTHKGAA